MEFDEVSEALRVARAAQELGQLNTRDWPGLAVALLLEGADDPEIAQLAGFNQHASYWDIEPVLAPLFDRHAAAAPGDTEEAVVTMAGLMAADLRARPAAVTSPMIRLLARLAPPHFSSDLANRCYGAEEYLDCDCADRVDPNWEAELDALPGPRLPDAVIHELARPLRSKLPAVQPDRSH